MGPFPLLDGARATRACLLGACWPSRSKPPYRVKYVSGYLYAILDQNDLPRLDSHSSSLPSLQTQTDICQFSISCSKRSCFVSTSYAWFNGLRLASRRLSSRSNFASSSGHHNPPWPPTLLTSVRRQARPFRRLPLGTSSFRPRGGRRGGTRPLRPEGSPGSSARPVTRAHHSMAWRVATRVAAAWHWVMSTARP